MSLFTPKTVYVEVPAAQPPTLEDVFNGASASSGYAKSIFQDAVDELVSANSALDDVEMRATSEIDRLTQLRDAATSQRKANVSTIENLQALIG